METIEVKGAIHHARMMQAGAMREFIEAFKGAVSYQRTLSDELIERAPEELREKLRPVLSTLFAHGTASFDLTARECGGDRKRTRLITKLYAAWGEAVDVDIDGAYPDRITFHAAEP